MKYTEITKKFCHENFLAAPLSTGLDTLKSQNNDYSGTPLRWTPVGKYRKWEKIC